MIVIIMGVAGSGKSTVARVLAKHLCWEWKDADSYHSEAKVAKMSSGVALTDEDRNPWLQAMRSEIAQWISADKNMILACSALKREYRDILMVNESAQHFVYLKGPAQLFAARLAKRKSHFMKQNMLKSQFEALEEPGPDEATICDARKSIKEIVLRIERALNSSSGASES